jgi:hypothetical protein
MRKKTSRVLAYRFIGRIFDENLAFVVLESSTLGSGYLLNSDGRAPMRDRSMLWTAQLYFASDRSGRSTPPLRSPHGAKRLTTSAATR